MKAITIKQPYAWAVVSGIKDIENRSWYTHHRGALLIHAAAAFDRDWADDWPEDAPLPPDGLPLGAIVGQVNVIDCLQVEEEGDAENEELEIVAEPSPWAIGPFLWILEGAVAFAEPIACKGKLGFWVPPPAVLERISAWTQPA